MLDYKSYVLGEDIKNLDICFIGSDDLLYLITDISDYGRNIVLVNMIWEYTHKHGERDTLKKGSIVRGARVELNPKNMIGKF